VKRLRWPRRRNSGPDDFRPGYLTAEQHVDEAERLLWCIDGELQADTPRTLGELAVIAMAHAFTAVAADMLSEKP